jgi:hypothetical protein
MRVVSPQGPPSFFLRAVQNELGRQAHDGWKHRPPKAGDKIDHRLPIFMTAKQDSGWLAKFT